MFAMYAANVAMQYLAADFTSGTFGRIRSFGVTRSRYLFAGYLSAVIMSVLFVTVMTVVTKVFSGCAGSSVSMVAFHVARFHLRRHYVLHPVHHARQPKSLTAPVLWSLLSPSWADQLHRCGAAAMVGLITTWLQPRPSGRIPALIQRCRSGVSLTN